MPKPKASNNDNNNKEAPSAKRKSTDKPCKSISNILTSCHPSIPELCKCGTSMDNTVASIPWILDWPVSFPLQSATEYVSALGLNPETIVLILSNKLGGRIAYLEDSYRKISANEKHINIIMIWLYPNQRGFLINGDQT